MNGEASIRCVVHLRGLLWSCTPDDVRASVSPLLPARCFLHDVFLPLDARARPSGTAVLVLHAERPAAASSERSVDAAVAAAARRIAVALDGAVVRGDDDASESVRHLRATPSSARALKESRARSSAAAARALSLAPQSFNAGAAAATTAIAAAPSRRDFVVVCHAAAAAASGAFELSDLSRGRVDLIARCASAALFTSHGVRRGCRLWLPLVGGGLTLCLDGDRARRLRPGERSTYRALARITYFIRRAYRPDERSIAAPLRVVLRRHVQEVVPGGEEEAAASDTAAAPAGVAGEAEGGGGVDGGGEGGGGGGGGERGKGGSGLGGGEWSSQGWSVHGGDSLESLLDKLGCASAEGGRCGGRGACGGRTRLVALHEGGGPLGRVVASSAAHEAGGRAAGGGREAGEPAGGERRRVVAVLGDHLGLTTQEEEALRRRGAAFCTVGPTALLSSHCIVLAHHALDILDAG